MTLIVVSPSNAETISPRRLLEVVDFSTPVISPDGTRVAFRIEQPSIERNTYDTAWYVQGMDGSAPPRRVADGGVPLRDSAGVSLPAPTVWSQDGRWIYYRARLDGRIDVWRAAVDGSGAEPVTRDSADVREFSLSADGNTLFYAVGATREAIIDAEQAEYDRGIRIDETVPIAQPLFRSGNVEGRLATQRFSREWFERAPLLARAPDQWKLLDLPTRRKQDAAQADRPRPPPAVSDLFVELPDLWLMASEPGDGRVAVLVRSGDGEGLLSKPDVELVMLPGRKASRPVACLAELCRGKAISNIQWRPASDEILFTVTDPKQGWAQSIFRWDVHTGAVHPVVRSSGLVSGGRDRFSGCGLSVKALACVAAEADGPPRLERIDLDTGGREVLFEPNADLARSMATAPARLLRWADARGAEFTGRFFAARGSGDVLPPLFVTYYSCTGFLRGNVGDEWPLAALAEQGISVLCINMAPYRLDAAERYDLGLSAVSSAIDLLASKGEIDRSRIGMGGLSFGSEVTYWTMMRSDLLAAASVASPFLTPTSHRFRSLAGDGFFDNRRKYWQLGTLEETPDRWRELSPVFNLDKMQTPLLMQMSEQEYLHALDYAIPLIRGHRGDLYVFPHEPHQKFQPRHKLAVYERNVDWFRFWLQGFEDEDPRKVEQYKHWGVMREHTCADAMKAGGAVPWYCQPK